MDNNLLYQVNQLNDNDKVVNTQSVNQNNSKYIIDILKNDSDFIDNISTQIDDIKKTKTETKYKVTKVNIDSSHRNKIPKNILEQKIFYLNDNPLSFTKNSNEMLITSNEEHNLNMDDRIILKNVSGGVFFLKGGISIKKNSNYIKINHINHNITDEILKNNNFNIQISGAIGTTNNKSSYNNISIALINKIHKLYLYSEDDNVGNEDYYYIKIPIIPNNDIIDNTSNIKIVYRNIAGISINNINSDYPIDFNHSNGFLQVSQIVNKKQFKVLLKEQALIKVNNIGGNKIFFSKIKTSIPAYTKPNNYIINLNKTFHNVNKIKLVSTIFPNTEKIIKETPEELRNNKLYFQVLEDGDFIYQINITGGNYTSNGLENEIKKQIDSITRFNKNKLLLKSEKTNNATIEYSNKFSTIVNIDQFTEIFTLNLFNIIILEKALFISNEEYDDGRIRIIVNHYEHNLSLGDNITIQGSLSFDNIPQSVLNKEHIIENIIDNNNYIIKIPKFNPLQSQNNTVINGGNAINILVPLNFRLLFNYKDTIGDIIGFRNVGEFNSITKFDKIAKNNQAYENDYFFDAVGNPIDHDDNNVQNQIIKLFGNNYIIMSCSAFSNEAITSNNINNTFAKLLLSGAPGSILFDQFIQLADILEKPIKTLNELEFLFYTAEGFLYDFNNLDHSFTIEIYEEINNLHDINISSNSNSNFKLLNNDKNKDKKNIDNDKYNFNTNNYYDIDNNFNGSI